MRCTEGVGGVVFTMHDPGAMTLGVEIANPSGGVAAVALGVVSEGDWSGARIVGEERLVEVARDRDDLVPAIGRLVDRCGLELGGVGLKGVKRVAVSAGPGGFTATRVACATGAMIAEGVGAMGVAVPSALVAVVAGLRAGTVRAGERVVVLMASKGETVWSAVVQTDGAADQWPGSARAGVVRSAAEVAAVIRTERGAGRADDFGGGGGEGRVVVLSDVHVPAVVRAAAETAGARMVDLKVDAGACVAASALCPAIDPAAMVPIYPREPEAVTLWRKRHGERGQSAGPEGG